MFNKDWIVGFVEGEGSFCIGMHFAVFKKGNYKSLSSVFTPKFSIELHYKDLYILEEIRKFFNGAGKIWKSPANSLHYKKRNIKASDHYMYYVVGEQCEKIKIFFINNPLFSSKKVQFAVWCRIMDILKNKNLSYSKDDILQIAKLRDEMSPNRRSSKYINHQKILEIFNSKGKFLLEALE